MSPWLKIVLIFVLFVGSISTVALLVDSEPVPRSTQEPILFDSTPEPAETPPLATPESPDEDPAAVSAPVTRRAPAPEPVSTPRRISGTGSIDVDSGDFEEGSDCGGDTNASGQGETVEIDSDEDEDC